MLYARLVTSSKGEASVSHAMRFIHKLIKHRVHRDLLIVSTDTRYNSSGTVDNRLDSRGLTAAPSHALTKWNQLCAGCVGHSIVVLLPRQYFGVSGRGVEDTLSLVPLNAVV